MNLAVNSYDVLFLDIETVSKEKSFQDLSDTFKQLWNRKHFQLVKNEEISAEESYTERAAIYAEFGKIVCISCGYLAKGNGKDTLRIKSFYNDDEAVLLKEFGEMLRNNYSDIQSQTLCGHNIKEFDIPYLCRRMLVNGLDLPDMLNIHGKKPWEVNFIDTLHLWKFGDYKAYTSLNLLAALFDIPTPKDDIDGSMVGKVYWEEKDLERIKIYCQKDVVTVVRLLQKMQGDEFIEDESVFIVE